MNATASAPPARRRARRPAGGPALDFAALAALAAAALTLAGCGSGSATSATSVATASSTTSTTAVSASTTTTTTTATTTTTTTATTTATTVARPSATIDQLVDTAGPRTHVRCVGHGDTTVVLIAGFGSSSSAWGKVEPAIARRARVCSYDRPGTGTSDPAASVSTFRTEATDLHDLLHTIGEPGPYVVVGHSFGGAEAVTFASQYPNDLAGLVLVDASPTTWPAAVCAVADDGTEAASVLRTTCTTAFPPSGNSEHLDVITGFADVARITSLGSVRMAVLTAATRELPTGLATGEATRLTEVWNQGQQAWLRLSTSAHLVTVERTGHHIEIDQPAVVIDEIARLLP